MLMTRGDGLEVIEAINGLDRDASIVAMSGAGQHMLALAHSVGARSVLIKPIGRESLIEAIEEALKPAPELPDE